MEERKPVYGKNLVYLFRPHSKASAMDGTSTSPQVTTSKIIPWAWLPPPSHATYTASTWVPPSFSDLTLPTTSPSAAMQPHSPMRSNTRSKAVSTTPSDGINRENHEIWHILFYCCPLKPKEHKYSARSPFNWYFGLVFQKVGPL